MKKRLTFLLIALTAIMLFPGMTSVSMNLNQDDWNSTSGSNEVQTRAASPDTHHNGWQILQTDGVMMGGDETSPTCYYLSGDTQLSADIVLTSGHAVLCLNGYKLTGTGNSTVITINEGAHLTVCDCMEDSQAPEHQHNYYVADNGLWTFYEGELPAEAPENAATGSINGGVITGGVGQLSEGYTRGGAILVEGSLDFESGAIAGNYVAFNTDADRGYGAGIYALRGVVTMNGGTVAGNVSDGSGAGIYAYDGATFNFQDGVITGNHSGVNGGGVSIANNGTFHLQGGEITGNSCNDRGGGVTISNYGTLNMSGGQIHGNKAVSGTELATYGTSTITGGMIDGTIRRAAGNIYFRGGYHNITELYYGNGERPQVTGGYFTDVSYNQVALWVIGGYTMVQIDAQFGDSDYKESYPWAVYTLDETRITATVEEDIVYDGEPIAQDVDFTLTGTDNLTMQGYTYTMQGSEDSLNGLPTDAGSFSISVAGFDNTTKTFYPTTFGITINKAEWIGSMAAEGTVEADIAGCVLLPDIPENATFGTPTGDPEVKDLSIADNKLIFLGGSEIEVGETYNVTIPVSSPNYLDYDITVTLTGIDSSGIGQTEADGSFRLVGMRGCLRILDSDKEVTVYNTAGTAVYQGLERTVYVPAGIYLVRIGAKVERVIVR